MKKKTLIFNRENKSLAKVHSLSLNFYMKIFNLDIYVCSSSPQKAEAGGPTQRYHLKKKKRINVLHSSCILKKYFLLQFSFLHLENIFYCLINSKSCKLIYFYKFTYQGKDMISTQEFIMYLQSNGRSEISQEDQIYFGPQQ